MNEPLKNTSKELKKTLWISIASSVAIHLILVLIGIYYIEEYGIFLFFFVPLSLGILSVMLIGLKHTITYKQSLKVGFLSLLFLILSLFIFAIEGAVCLLMMLPVGASFTFLGVFIGYSITKKFKNHAFTTLLLLLTSMVTTAYVETNTAPQLQSVTTSVMIKAPTNVVWKNVIAFPTLEEPDEIIFKTGIAYPIDATITGEGVGAIRFCNFTTGSFVEPITVWDEPSLLMFDVEEQPAPMKELSIWDINAPHLHDFFCSQKGQFKLTELSNGYTLLEGTTWYYNKIKPNFYWNIWSDYIIHKIHERVLTHIQKSSEK